MIWWLIIVAYLAIGWALMEFGLISLQKDPPPRWGKWHFRLIVAITMLLTWPAILLSGFLASRKES